MMRKTLCILLDEDIDLKITEFGIAQDMELC
jgi:hypothetical protein